MAEEINSRTCSCSLSDCRSEHHPVAEIQTDERMQSLVEGAQRDPILEWFRKIDYTTRIVKSRLATHHELRLEFTRPWNLVFETPSGSGTDIGSASGIIYCGLKTGTVERATIRHLYRYVRLGGMVKYVPDIILDAEVKLEQTQGARRHAGLWYKPTAANETTIRLEFGLKEQGKWNELWSEIPAIECTAPTIVCRKRLSEVQTGDGVLASCQGQLAYCVNMRLLEKPGSSAEKAAIHEDDAIKAVLEFHETSVRLVIDFADTLDIVKLLRWLVGLVGMEESTAEESFPPPKTVVPEIRARRLTLVFAPRQRKLSLKTLRGFQLDMEALMDIGKGEQEGPVTFLLSYNWTKGGVKLGSLRGMLWTTPSQGHFQSTSPPSEWWYQLRPLSAPAKYIDLARLNPGQAIENIPEYIPRQVSRLQVYLSKERIEFGASIRCVEVSQGSVPQPFLGELQLDAAYAFESKAFKLKFGVKAGIYPCKHSRYPKPGMLIGAIAYDSGQNKWEFNATLEGARLALMADFFEPDNQVMPLIESIEIRRLKINYIYQKESNDRNQNETSTEPRQTSFSIEGTVMIAGLDLKLNYAYPKQELTIRLTQQETRDSTVGKLVNAITGSNHELPGFLAQLRFSRHNGLHITVRKNEDRKTWTFAAELTFAPIRIIFAQCMSKMPDDDRHFPKRLINVSLEGDSFQLPDIPLVGPMAAPFKELTYTWVHDGTPMPSQAQGRGNARQRGFTEPELGELLKAIASMKPQAVLRVKARSKESSEPPSPAEGIFILLSIPSLSLHRAPTLPYGECRNSTMEAQGEGGSEVPLEETTVEDASVDSTAQAPLKTKTGETLFFLLDGTVEAGPVAFTLLGLKIGWKVALDRPPKLGDFSFQLEGMSAALQRPPLTLAGSFRHLDDGTGNPAYAGGLILGFEPYLLQAAGLYRNVKDEDDRAFPSLFVQARLQGPLLTIGYAEISGVQGGFGYNSYFRTPQLHEVNEHYFSPKTIDTAAVTAAQLTERMNEIVRPHGWFQPKRESYWAAAGLSVKACQMISLDAVLALQLDSSGIKIMVLAVGTVDIPSPKAKLKFAHVELGFQAVIEVDYGTLVVSAALARGSFILHPDCHLTGGFGLAYWFDGPKADQSRVGDYVLTLGGYHRAFSPPKDWPNPPRLTITWSISEGLSIEGEAYFAITPKVCMAGGRLRATLELGWLRAWFDAFVDLLINYEPFQFEAVMQVNVGVGFTLGWGILAWSGSLEVGAELTLWGPPLAGRVHIDCWVHAFDIEFGESRKTLPPPTLLSFYRAVLQIKGAEQVEEEERVEHYRRPRNEAHIFRALSGLVNRDEPDNSNNQAHDKPWTVRAGNLSLLVTCKIPLQTVTDKDDRTILEDETSIYAKPMQGARPLTSRGTLTIKVAGSEMKMDDWRLEKQLGPAPKALWEQYNPDSDPTRTGHRTTGDLLDGSRSGNLRLMTGFVLRAPKAQMSPDNLAKVLYPDAPRELEKKYFPAATESSGDWLPGVRKDGSAQWVDVHDTWRGDRITEQEPAVADAEHEPSSSVTESTRELSPTAEATSHPRNSSQEETEPTVVQFVARWEKLMHWESGTLSRCATMPAQMNERFMHLFADAPSISV